MKYCIFDEKKVCNNCGDCDICEYNKDKICDNCGKCLEIEGYDIKAIKIDEVFEKSKDDEVKIDLEEFSDFDTAEDEDNFDEDSLSSQEDMPYIDALDNDENWDYISDIEGMDDLIEETDKEDLLHEKYPGLYVVNKKI
jgi:hypothetical protein